MDSDFVPNARPKRILVIGGGASGLVTLRNLRERGDFDDVQLVERRDDVGGVWYLHDGHWPSPAYPGLIGNVLPEFLSFSAFPPFPEPSSTDVGQPFPSLAETHAYLRSFAAPLLASGAIRLNTEVLAVEELPERAGWRVHMRRGSETIEETWDAVVVAVAFYDHPVYPQTPGLSRLQELGLAHHAQRWRGPRGYESQRVLVIGNANSGNDIAAQLAPVASSVYQSIRRPNFPGFPSLADPRITRVAPVMQYLTREDSATGKHVVDARLTDGTVITDLDSVLFGTGYCPCPDFVRILSPSSHSLQPLVLSSSPSPSTPTIPRLHRYTLYVPNPSLAFVGTAFASYTPFTVADMCSTWLALAWSADGGITYPTSLQALLAFEASRVEAVEAGRVEAAGGGEPSALIAYGVLGPFEEEFAAGLREEVVRVRPEMGDVLPVWSPERTEVREAMFGVKRRALELAAAQVAG
ncbi:hypothetical protein FB45DRAFT_1060988 [Roridomyces roridus]|uniref:FAD/NAD(P)-binding domain-containing protein n=1 Tax=Roridomyces roridus TaxID=1738132 RepID=A0AAD7FKD6_9AGAR|nr:hypothetical protein FB45DRAFT_1060988 [Roridomyces roridus]